MDTLERVGLAVLAEGADEFVPLEVVEGYVRLLVGVERPESIGVAVEVMLSLASAGLARIGRIAADDTIRPLRIDHDLLIEDVMERYARSSLANDEWGWCIAVENTAEGTREAARESAPVMRVLYPRWPSSCAMNPDRYE